MVLLLAGLHACGTSYQQELRQYYRQQVHNRITSLAGTDSIRAAGLEALNARIEKIVLISKDAENAVAAVNLANNLFDSLIAAHKFNGEDFVKLHTKMDLSETELQLRENALAYYNRLLMNEAVHEDVLFTAH